MIVGTPLVQLQIGLALPEGCIELDPRSVPIETSYAPYSITPPQLGISSNGPCGTVLWKKGMDVLCGGCSNAKSEAFGKVELVLRQGDGEGGESGVNEVLGEAYAVVEVGLPQLGAEG